MIAPLRADPGNAGDACFLGGHFSGAFHHQMTHTVVAVDERHARSFLHHFNLWPNVHATRANPARIRHHTNHAMSIRALQIGLGHQRAHRLRIGIRHTEFHECIGDELLELVEGNCFHGTIRTSRESGASIVAAFMRQRRLWLRQPLDEVSLGLVHTM